MQLGQLMRGASMRAVAERILEDPAMRGEQLQRALAAAVQDLPSEVDALGKVAELRHVNRALKSVDIERASRSLLAEHCQPSHFHYRPILADETQVLEYVCKHESVHAQPDAMESYLRYPNCIYGMFHERGFLFSDSGLAKPVVFMLSCLMKARPDTLREIVEAPILQQDEYRVAVFYAINAPVRGMQGLNLGTHCLKGVCKELKARYPQLENFVTLSPLPFFKDYLGERAEGEYVRMGPAAQVQTVIDYLDRFTDAGKLVDPVGNFHLGNGAIVHDVYLEGDTRAKRMGESMGAMVSYDYSVTGEDPVTPYQRRLVAHSPGLAKYFAPKPKM